MKTKGFTLVELLVVIAILAILATVSVVGYTSYISSTEEKAALTEAGEVHGAIEKALVLDKQVEVKLGDNNVVVITRTATGYTVAKADAMSDTIVDLTGIPAELVAKLSFVAASGDASAYILYKYDTVGTYQYDVITNTKK